MSALSGEQFPQTYVVVTHHTSGTRTKKFGSFEEAHEHGKSLDPMGPSGGDVYPNIPDEVLDKYTARRHVYERGLFSGPNRYGAVMRRLAKGERRPV
jgi:hypothetical protein